MAHPPQSSRMRKARRARESLFGQPACYSNGSLSRLDPFQQQATARWSGITAWPLHFVCGTPYRRCHKRASIGLVICVRSCKPLPRVHRTDAASYVALYNASKRLCADVLFRPMAARCFDEKAPTPSFSLRVEDLCVQFARADGKTRPKCSGFRASKSLGSASLPPHRDFSSLTDGRLSHSSAPLLCCCNGHRSAC